MPTAGKRHSKSKCKNRTRASPRKKQINAKRPKSTKRSPYIRSHDPDKTKCCTGILCNLFNFLFCRNQMNSQREENQTLFTGKSTSLMRQNNKYCQPVCSNQDTSHKAKDQKKEYVYSNYATSKTTNQAKRKVQSRRTAGKRGQDQQNSRRPGHQKHTVKPRGKDKHKQNFGSGQRTKETPTVKQNQPAFIRQQLKASTPQYSNTVQYRPKQDVRVGQITTARVQDLFKQVVRIGQITTARAKDRPKQDVSVGQVSMPEEQNQPESCQGKGSRVQDHSSEKIPPKTPMSRSQDEPKQPKYNSRFLHDLQTSGNSLKRLHDEKVKQDPDKTKRCNEIVDNLVKFMQHNVKYKVSEVVKGGSLGKGTSIKEKVDIDLVVFVKDLKSVADLQERHEEVIKDFKKHILKDFTFAKQVHYSYDTKHSNRFGIRIDDSKDLIQVDLLPACDIGGGSTSTFREMARVDEEARGFYSVSFAKDQKQFIKEKPEPVKEAIRLVKDWKTREKLKIPSYTAEIVTSKEWERMGRPDKPDLDQLFKRTMTQFSDMDNINVAWSNSRATGDSGPIVMDPANPFNNTASMIGQSDQEVIERKAREVVEYLS